MVKTIVTSLQELLGSAIKTLPGIITGLIILMLTRYAAEYARKIAEKIGNRALQSKSLQSLLIKTADITAWVVGVVTASIVAFPGLSVGDIIATLGVSTVAIGLIFQDIFKNFLAGILILIQRPFHINDQIIVGDYEGTVEQIDIRTTRLCTYDGERILIPNAQVIASSVRVRTAFTQRRTDLAVAVDYNTSLPAVQKILQTAIAGVEGVLEDRPPEIDIVGFGESSLDFVVRYWTHPRQPQVRQIQTRAIIAVKEALDTAKIKIPYPIRTLYLETKVQTVDLLTDLKGR